MVFCSSPAKGLDPLSIIPSTPGSPMVTWAAGPIATQNSNTSASWIFDGKSDCHQSTPRLPLKKKFMVGLFLGNAHVIWWIWMDCILNSLSIQTCGTLGGSPSFTIICCDVAVRSSRRVSRVNDVAIEFTTYWSSGWWLKSHLEKWWS